MIIYLYIVNVRFKGTKNKSYLQRKKHEFSFGIIPMNLYYSSEQNINNNIKN